MTPSYHRVMLKVSGEALSGGKGPGIDTETIGRTALEIKEIHDLGVQIGLVCGGGNFWRGARNGLVMERSRADHMGMLATVMNCLALSEAFEQVGVKTRVMSNVAMPLICEQYQVSVAQRYLDEGYVVLFGGGTGCPYFTTDTGVVLKAIEMHCDLLLMGKNVDGIYDSDPNKNPDAKKFDEITYQEVLERGLTVTDLTAMSLLKDNPIPVLLFKVGENSNLRRAITGEKIGSIIKEKL